ncbi:hypothetical protein HRW14_06600 [Streptomyces lunaelactis]|uniref:SGNH/GDSL hydrolase family protein n=1 Tax=Streptomyces lunaelactis TaxID=1535768 RepID=UPI0015851955|nr:hypothetical protein [Streptomyces lunaelactis]NUK64228.1 hypothetical protein [Streptomyces lunaelactis]
MSTAPARLSRLIDTILAFAPDATVLVATLVPSTKPAVQARIEQYNKQMPEVVEEQQRNGRHVRLVNMDTVTTADMADGLHPKDSGYQKMANAFHQGILDSIRAGWIATPVPGGKQPCHIEPGGGESGGGSSSGPWVFQGRSPRVSVPRVIRWSSPTSTAMTLPITSSSMARGRCGPG